MSPCKIDEYTSISGDIKELLGLEASPVAVKLFLTEEEAQETLEKIDESIRHCQMVQKAANGASFYATLDEQACKGGAAALGYIDFPEPLVTGKKYYKLGRFASMGSAKHELNQVAKVENFTKAIGYAPLEDAKFEADVIVFFCKPVDAMVVSQAHGYVLGKRFKADFAGIQSVCADVVASPYIKKEPNMSVGCSGSRKFAKIKPEELVVGLNMENLGCFVNSLKSILE